MSGSGRNSKKHSVKRLQHLPALAQPVPPSLPAQKTVPETLCHSSASHQPRTLAACCPRPACSLLHSTAQCAQTQLSPAAPPLRYITASFCTSKLIWKAKQMGDSQHMYPATTAFKCMHTKTYAYTRHVYLHTSCIKSDPKLKAMHTLHMSECM